MRSISQPSMKVLIELDVPGLGERIRQARVIDRRTLIEICDLAGMTKTNWYRIEEEKQALPLETLRRIEEVLGVNFGIKD